MEPSASDVAAVQAALTGQPAPQAPAPQPQPAQPTQPEQQPQQPAQQQPVQPVQQPSPSQQPAQQQPNNDPFTSLFAQPTEPGQPQAPAQQPTQPTEPGQVQQPQQVEQQPQQPTQPQPGQVVQPVQQPQQPQAPQYQTTEQYLDAVFQGVPQAPAQPDPSKINPDDPEAIKGFFNELVTTAVQQAETNIMRKQTIQNHERNLWEQAFTKYGSLRSNPELRSMVHAIRRAEFDKGIAITPTQAADRLLDTLKAQYQRGVADNQVVTTIEQVQPTGGNGTAVQTTMDADKALLAVQTGGEQALAQVLDAQIKAGQR